MQQQQSEIETIYQSAPNGLWAFDRELRFVRVNQRLADMNGLPINAHLDRTVWDLLPNLVDQAEAMLHPILETGEPLMNVEISGETLSRREEQLRLTLEFTHIAPGTGTWGKTPCSGMTITLRYWA